MDKFKCKNKAYINELVALEALVDIKRKMGNKRRKEIRAYCCGRCGLWHVSVSKETDSANQKISSD